MEANADKPYLARIEFENENGINDNCYIGKIGISNYDNEVIIVDWRAPISSLYYDSNVGKASYKVDDEILKGNLNLKRQYDIENRQLMSFNDVDNLVSEIKQIRMKEDLYKLGITELQYEGVIISIYEKDDKKKIILLDVHC